MKFISATCNRLKPIVRRVGVCVCVAVILSVVSCDLLKVTSHTISGTVELCGGQIEGVSVTLMNDRFGPRTAITNALGEYSFTDVWQGDYTLTAVKDGYTFTPEKRSVTIGSADITTQDFLTIVTWSRVYPVDADAHAYSVQQTSDCGFIIGGYKNVAPVGQAVNYDMWIIKLDMYGDEEWSKTFGSNDMDVIYSVRQAHDGGYIAAGDKLIKVGAGGPGGGIPGEGGDALVTRLDADGTITWQKTFGGDKTDSARSIIQTTDGNYLFAGFTDSFGTGFCDMWIVKLDTLGNAISGFTKTFSWPPDGNVYYERSYTLTESRESTSPGTWENYYIIAGSREYNEQSDGIMLKLQADDFSAEEWAHYYQANQSTGGMLGIKNNIFGVKTTEDGYVTTGYTDIAGAGMTDIWVMKVDLTGTVQWEYITGGTKSDIGLSIEQTTDLGYIIGGSKFVSRGLQEDYCIIKLDKDGISQWEQTFDGTDGSKDEMRAVQQTFDGGFILVGNTQTVSGNDRVFVLKLDKFGEKPVETTGLED